MSFSRRILLFYITLIVALCAIAAPVDMSSSHKSFSAMDVNDPQETDMSDVKSHMSREPSSTQGNEDPTQTGASGEHSGDGSNQSPTCSRPKTERNWGRQASDETGSEVGALAKNDDEHHISLLISKDHPSLFFHDADACGPIKGTSLVAQYRASDQKSDRVITAPDLTMKLSETEKLILITTIYGSTLTNKLLAIAQNVTLGANLKDPEDKCVDFTSLAFHAMTGVTDQAPAGPGGIQSDAVSLVISPDAVKNYTDAFAIYEKHENATTGAVRCRLISLPPGIQGSDVSDST